ncbi:hypothetical protein HK102_008471, partial [Quaeritorhiza haematococci]
MATLLAQFQSPPPIDVWNRFLEMAKPFGDLVSFGFPTPDPPSLLAHWETCLQWVTEAVTTKNLTLRPDCEEQVVQTILDFVIPKLAVEVCQIPEFSYIKKTLHNPQKTPDGLLHSPLQEVTSWLDVAVPLEYKPPKDTSYEGSGQVLGYLAIIMSQLSAGCRKGLGIFTNMNTIQFVLVDGSAYNYTPRFDFLPTRSVNTLNSGPTRGFALLCAVLQGPLVNNGFQLQPLTFKIGGESYHVRRHLGTGGQSNVYKVVSPRQECFAAKLPRDLVSDAAYQQL